MDYDKLIDDLRVACAGNQYNIMGAAATTLTTLQAENEKLRTDLEYEREHMNAYHEECGQWEAENAQLRKELEWKDKVIQLAQREERKAKAELEQVKREKEAAVDCIYKIEDALDRGNDNDWAREYISEWEGQKGD